MASMLRLGLHSTTRRLHMAATTDVARFSFLGLPVDNRYLSTQAPSNEEEPDRGASASDEKDPLQAFFERRKRSNQDRQMQQQRQPGNNRNRNQNRNQRNNRDGGNNPHAKRNRDQRQNNNQFNSQRRPNAGQSQNDNRRQNNHRQTQSNATQSDNRLSDLISQLRKTANKDRANAAQAAASSSNDRMRQPGRQAEGNVPAWRQRYNQQSRQGPDDGDRPRLNNRRFLMRRENGFGNDNDRYNSGSDQEERMSRRQQRYAKRVANQQFDRPDVDFLQGRRSRSEDLNGESVAMERRPSAEPVTLPNGQLSLTEASHLFRVKIGDIKFKLRGMGERPTDDTLIDTDLLELLAWECGIETVRSEEENVVVDSEELLMQQRRMEEALAFPPRAPVVCIMGHVDHGKTTLMDSLRRRAEEQQKVPKAKKSKGKKKKKNASAKGSSDIAGTEAGGITQIISAFQVAMEGSDSKITFLDTPGHAAFKSMRQSGSHAADVIVLVVAADDGVSEQTVEIIDFYKSIVKGSDGAISMVVALNKIDKPGIEVDEARMRVENQLLEHGILCEGMPGESEFGPPVQVIPTSGLSGLGLEDLMEGLLLQSEVMDLRADQEAHGEGIVMDARLEKGLGVVADCVVRWGSVTKGDIVVSGTQVARIRMLKDVNDKPLKRGEPSQPVRIVGFKSLPKAGDPIVCVDCENAAADMAELRAELEASNITHEAPRDLEVHINGMRSRDTARSAKVHKLADLAECDGTIRIPIIVKADADGSLSAVRDSLVGIGEKSLHKVVVDPILSGIGDITATDIQMAKESDACIFAFGLKRIDQAMLNMAETENVVIRSNDIIYSLLDDAKETLGRYLPAQPVEHSHGRAMVQAIFSIDTDIGSEKVAGLKVTDGHMYKAKAPMESGELNCHFRVFRDGEQISPAGESVGASSLRKFKELVDSVRRGEECGLALTGFTEFQEGDEIECYSMQMKNGSL